MSPSMSVVGASASEVDSAASSFCSTPSRLSQSVYSEYGFTVELKSSTDDTEGTYSGRRPRPSSPALNPARVVPRVTAE